MPCAKASRIARKPGTIGGCDQVIPVSPCGHGTPRV
jgi:hypothetical protein